MSNSIDERVVVLRFDNAQFESATKTSMNTLDRLKASLKLDKSAKSLENLGKSTRTFSLGGMITAIETVGQRFSNLGIVGMTVISQLTKAAMGMAKNVLAAIPAQIAHGGWKRALNIEQAKFQIDGLGKSWEELYKDMDYAVDQTAYGIDAAAKAASQLAASGIEAGDEMKSALRGISGVAAMTSSDYESIAMIFTKVAGNGRLMGDELLQLSSRGINAAATIKDFFNGVNNGTKDASDDVKNSIKELTGGLEVTEGDIRDFVTGSKISFAMFSEAMDQSFGEHAKDANKTFTGSLSNVKAALSRIGADVAEVQLFNLMNVFNAIRPIINNVRYALQPFIIALNKLSLAASGKLIENLGKVEKALQPFADKGKELKSKWDEELKGIKESWNGAADSATSSGEQVSDAVEKIGHALDENGNVIRVTAEEAQAAWDIWNKGTYGNQPEREKNLAKVGLEYKYVQAYVNDLIAANFDLSKTTIEVADASAEATSKAEAQAAATEGVKKAADSAANGMKSVAGQFADFNKKTKPLLKIANSIKNIFTGLKNIIVAVAKVAKPIFSAIASSVLPVIGKVLTGIEKLTGKFAEATGKLKVTAKAQANIYNVTKSILSVIGSVIKVLIEVGKVIGTIVLAPFKLLINAFKDGNSKIERTGKALAKFQSGAEKIKGFFDTIAKGLAKFREFLTTNETLAKVGEKLIDLFKRIGEWFKELFTNIKNFFAEVKDSEGVQHLKESLSQLWEVIKNLASEKFRTVIDRITELTGKSINAPSFEKAVDLFSNLADKAGTFIDNVAQGNGPLKKFWGFFTGDNILGKFTKSFKLSTDGFFSFFKSLKDAKIGDGFKKFTSEMAGTNFSFTDSFSHFTDWLSSVNWGETLNMVQTMLKTIGLFKVAKSFSGLMDSMTGLNKSLSNFLTGMLDVSKKKVKTEMFKSIAIGIALLAASLFLISKIPVNDLKRSVITLAIIAGGLVTAFAVLNKLKVDLKQMAKIGTALISIGAGMILITASMALLSKIKDDDVIRSGTIIASFIVLMSGAARLAGQGSFAGFFGMAVAIMVLVPAIKAFAKMPWKDVLKGGGIVVSLVIALSAAQRIANGSKPQGLLGMAVAIGILALAVGGLALLPAKRVIASTVAIGSVMTMMVILSKNAGKAGGIQKLSTLSKIVVAVAASLTVLSFIQPKRLMTSMAAISAVLIEVTVLSKMASMSLKGAGAIAIVLGVVTGAFIVLDKLDVSSALSSALSMSAVILAVAAAISLLQTVDPGQAAMVGADLAIVIGIIEGVFAALGALVNNWQGVGDAIETGSTLIGKSIGNLVSGFMSAFPEKEASQTLAEKIEAIGAALGTFAEQVQPVLDILNSKDNSAAFENLENLAKSFLDITAAGFIDSLPGGDGFLETLPTIASKMRVFAVNIMGFPDASDAVANFTACSDAVTGFADNIPRLKGKAEEAFFEQLPSIGTKMRTFAINLMGIPDVRSDIEIFTSCAVALTDFADAIPRLKNKAETAFFEQLPTVGSQMRIFAINIMGFPDVTDALSIFSQCGAALTTFADNIPRLKGKAEEAFFGQLPYIGGQMRVFAVNIMGLASTSSLDDINVFSQCATALTTFADNIPRFKKKAETAFFEALPAIGSHLRVFAINIMGMANAADDASSLSSIASALDSFDNTNITLLSSIDGLLPSLGQNLVDFINNVTSIDGSAANGVVEAVNKINNAAANIDTASFADAGKAANTNFKNGLTSTSVSGAISTFASGCVTALKNKSSSFKGAGSYLATAFKNGLTNSDLVSSGNKMASNVCSGIRDKVGVAYSAGASLASNAKSGAGSVSLYSTGKNLVIGFCNGISDNDYRAEAKAKAMAKKAKQAAEDALGVESPSKVFKQIGAYVVEGFAIGIDRNTRKSSLASEGMAKDAINTVRDSLETMSKFFNSDLLDTEPTITPVIDLSNVRSGASQINSLLSNQNGIGLSASISGTMQAQAMAGSDMLNAINSLANKLDSLEEAVKSNPGIDPEVMYSAVRAGASDANINMSMNGRELSRGLRDMGVAFS